ncbi:MAG TPA: zinc ABC transporter substrate-binding protein [Nostocaceae cyanobacterium]|nr:zinc ABC transporter substrate-binding protein [Nostocaceae cyanobacterium]
MFTKKFSITNIIYPSFIAAQFVLFGCTNQNLNTTYNQTNQATKNNPNLPQVVATTSVLCDLTKQVARDTIQLHCLIPPNEEPRLYQPKTEDIQIIKKANLIFYHGHNLEPSLVKAIKTNKNTAVKIAVGQIAVPNPQKLQRKDITFTEPHVWHNPKNTIRMLEVISNSLKKLSPKDAKIYSNNTKSITNELNRLDKWIWLRLSSIPPKNRKLVITHEAMLYYAKAYKIPYTNTLMGITTQDKLTANRVKNLAENIQKSKARTIFIDNTTNPDLFAPISKAANIQVFPRQLYIDGLGKPGSEAETYQQMMEANTRTIVEGLGGTYLKFEPKITQ